jgi:hypothetical protein
MAVRRGGVADLITFIHSIVTIQRSGLRVTINTRIYPAAGRVTAALRPPSTDLPSPKVPPYSSASSRVIRAFTLRWSAT